MVEQGDVRIIPGDGERILLVEFTKLGPISHNYTSVKQAIRSETAAFWKNLISAALIAGVSSLAAVDGLKRIRNSNYQGIDQIKEVFDDTRSILSPFGERVHRIGARYQALRQYEQDNRGRFSLCED